MRYVAIVRPKASDNWGDEKPIFDARTVYEVEDQPENTGLLDSTGTPLYRIRDKIKVGFI